MPLPELSPLDKLAAMMRPKAMASNPDPRLAAMDQIAEQQPIVPASGETIQSTGQPLPATTPDVVGNDPTAGMAMYEKIQNDKEAKAKQYLDAQKKGVQGNEAYNNALMSQPGQVDLSPLMSLIDSQTGSKLQAGYKAPQTPEEREKQIQSVQDLIQKQKMGITSEEMKALQDSGLRALLGADSKQKSLEYRQNQYAQKQFDSTQAPNIQRLQGAARISDLLSDAENNYKKASSSGDQNAGVAYNQQIKSLVNGEISRLETGAGQVAFGSQEEKDLKTTAQQWGEILQKLEAVPKNTVPVGIQQQIHNLSGSLAQSYLKAAESQSGILKAGALPNQQAIIDKKHAALMQQFGPRLQYLLSPMQTGPKVGDVQDGHKFKGGDPSKPESWEQQ